MDELRDGVELKRLVFALAVIGLAIGYVLFRPHGERFVSRVLDIGLAAGGAVAVLLFAILVYFATQWVFDHLLG